jgi:hypothetical protein
MAITMGTTMMPIAVVMGTGHSILLLITSPMHLLISFNQQGLVLSDGQNDKVSVLIILKNKKAAIKAAFLSVT